MILQGKLLDDPRTEPAIGWIRLDGDRIAETGHGDPPAIPAAGDETAIICPGFTDAHIHLPQMRSAGCDGMELLPWLDEVIFPAEARWADAAVAAEQTLAAYHRMLRSGTLAFGGYLTSHETGAPAVAAAAGRVPLRSLVGQVLMDRNAPAELLQPGPGRAIADPPDADRTTGSINPRFAVACSDDLLADAARRAGATGRVIQTHLAESIGECELVAELFPGDPSYTAVYDRLGLLGSNTLLAHALHLGEDEWSLIAERGCVVIHCPTANTFLGAGAFDLDAARRHGVRLALGSDVAAGPDVAMPRVGRAMIEVAKLRAIAGGATGTVPTPADAWSMITRGNAEALGFEDMGRLAVGAAADLLVLKPDLPDDRHLVGRLLYTWRDDYIDAIVLNGTLLKPNNTAGTPTQ